LKLEEEEREQRRKEKQELMEAAKKLREDEDKAREERARLRNEKEMKKKAEEDAAAAAEAEAKAKRREERELKKKQKEEEKRQLELERRLQWIATAKEDQWTQEEQNGFEEALLTSPMILSTAGSAMQKEKEAKWNFIATQVGTKNRNQCLTRYKLLLLLAADSQTQGREGNLKIAR
jgi:membrane protein involved in colicin uptake